MKTYLEYVSEVLGLGTVMLPSPLVAVQADADAELVKPAFFYSSKGAFSEGRDFKKCDLAIINWVQEPLESLFEPAVAKLFGKMLAAMKLSPNRVLVLDCVMNERNLIPNELYKVCDPQVVLFFSSDPISLSEVQIKGPARWLETLSPAALVKDPDSKKLVWNDMQRVMKEL